MIISMNAKKDAFSWLKIPKHSTVEQLYSNKNSLKKNFFLNYLGKEEKHIQTRKRREFPQSDKKYLWKSHS